MLFAPVEVVLAENTVFQPDVRVAAFTETDLPAVPLLAFEALAPSTRGVGLLLRNERLERAGCAHRWVIGPDEPSGIARSLSDSAYREATRTSGDGPPVTAAPFGVSLTAVSLIA